jgi:ankyrin repeat protein
MVNSRLISFADATFLCSVFEAAKLYFFCPHRDRVDLGNFKGFILMFAVKNRCEDAIMRLMDNATSKDGPTKNYGQKALLIGLALASQFVRHELDDEWHSISDARKDPKMSLFAWAVYCGHVDVARLLIEYGADVAEKDSKGSTPLQQAIRNGHEAVAQLLLAKGADFDPEVPEGSTLLHVAASNGNELEMRLLLERDFEIQAIDEHQWTPLHWAAFNGHQKVAHLLVQAGARLEAASDIGRTPLHVVNGLEKEDVMQLLLDKGSRIDANDVHKWTPLHVAANSGFAKIVDILLGWGSDIQAKTTGGLTPLHLAASNGHQATIKLLLDNGALVGSTTKRGWTVLHWVAAQGQVQAARMVLERNANIEAEDESGRTPLHVALSNEQEPMVQLLLEHGATSQGSNWAAFRVAASSGNDAILQLLCQQNVDLEAKDKHGRTALLLAALNGHVNVVQTLLLNGADLTSKTNSGWSALHCAVSRRHTSVVQLLLQYTSDVNLKCNQGWTVLHRASSVGDETITRLLLNRGAHIKELDGSGLTPLQQAAHNDHANVVSLLLAHGRNSMRIRNGPGFSATGLVSENEAFLSRMFKSLQRLEDNWDNGLCVKFQIPHPNYPKEAHTSAIYTIQYSQKYIVSGSRDQSIRIWDLDRRRLEINNAKRLSTGISLPGHSKSVLCLQFDHSPEEDVIISGSVDKSVIIWRFSTGEIVHMIKNAHQDSILNLKFDQKYLVTASKDKLIKVWNRQEILPTDDEFSWVYQSGDPFAVTLRETSASIIPIYSELRVLSGHGGAINSIQLLNDEIVSASGDCTVRVWCIRTGKCLLRIADAHTMGIASLQYDGTWIVTGSSDNTIGVFDRLTGSKVIKLEGHGNLVRSVQSKIYDLTTVDDPKQSSIDDVDQSLTKLKISDEPAFRRTSKIVSGSYDETIKIWRRDHEGKWFLRKTLHLDNPDTASHRIFNVQFDSRFLVYATQGNEIQGYDFANEDPEIIEAVTWLASL